MRDEARKYLFDMQQAADLIASFAAGRKRIEFEADPMLRSAVERQFEIIGEALAQLSCVEPAVADAIPDRRRIIAFRNLLIHRYSRVDPEIVWEVIQTNLPELNRTLSLLLDPSGPGSVE